LGHRLKVYHWLPWFAKFVNHSCLAFIIVGGSEQISYMYIHTDVHIVIHCSKTASMLQKVLLGDFVGVNTS
jgi:hypothetical protein